MGQTIQQDERIYREKMDILLFLSVLIRSLISGLKSKGLLKRMVK